MRTVSFCQLNFHPSMMLWPKETHDAGDRENRREDALRAEAAAVQNVAKKKNTAWIAYAPPVPNVAMSTPASAGPVLRATLKMIELRPMALVRWLEGTTSAIIAARAGC